MRSIYDQCKDARQVYLDMACLSTATKNKALQAMATAIQDHQDDILAANAQDMAQAKETGMAVGLQDRLRLDAQRLEGISQSLRDIAGFPDPVGDILDDFTRPNGLRIRKKRVPIGVIGIIYEARPNVTADAIGLCLKTGNAVVLRGSASAYHSNLAILRCLRDAAIPVGVPKDGMQLLEDTRRESVKTFVCMTGILDLVIPRGGAGLIQSVVQHATVPCIETGVGNCHVYVDRSANLDQAYEVVINSKTQRPSVCNACETLLLDDALPIDFKKRLLLGLQDKGVRLKGCLLTQALCSDIEAATADDWDIEFHDMILAVKCVEGLDAAISHIQAHGTLHTEAILAENPSSIALFSQKIDAACIAINASTRFTDGGEFGYGAEIGISTQKLHARGPMGLTELCSYQYLLEGSGQCR
ncbi:MAG: glutamate-5-semialdehyde dehydrogenase [bacterium]